MKTNFLQNEFEERLFGERRFVFFAGPESSKGEVEPQEEVVEDEKKTEEATGDPVKNADKVLGGLRDSLQDLVKSKSILSDKMLRKTLNEAIDGLNKKITDALEDNKLTREELESLNKSVNEKVEEITGVKVELRAQPEEEAVTESDTTPKNKTETKGVNDKHYLDIILGTLLPRSSGTPVIFKFADKVGKEDLIWLNQHRTQIDEIQLSKQLSDLPLRDIKDPRIVEIASNLKKQIETARKILDKPSENSKRLENDSGLEFSLEDKAPKDRRITLVKQGALASIKNELGATYTPTLQKEMSKDSSFKEAINKIKESDSESKVDEGVKELRSLLDDMKKASDIVQMGIDKKNERIEISEESNKNLTVTKDSYTELLGKTGEALPKNFKDVFDKIGKEIDEKSSPSKDFLISQRELTALSEANDNSVVKKYLNEKFDNFMKVMKEINERIDSGDLIFYKDSLKTKKEMGGGEDYLKEQLESEGEIEPKDIPALLVRVYEKEGSVGRKQGTLFMGSCMKKILNRLNAEYDGYEIQKVYIPNKEYVLVYFKNEKTHNRFSLEISRNGEMTVAGHKGIRGIRTLDDFSQLKNALQENENKITEITQRLEGDKMKPLFEYEAPEGELKYMISAKKVALASIKIEFGAIYTTAMQKEISDNGISKFEKAINKIKKSNSKKEMNERVKEVRSLLDDMKKASDIVQMGIDKKNERTVISKELSDTKPSFKDFTDKHGQLVGLFKYFMFTFAKIGDDPREKKIAVSKQKEISEENNKSLATINDSYMKLLGETKGKLPKNFKDVFDKIGKEVVGDKSSPSRDFLITKRELTLLSESNDNSVVEKYLSEKFDNFIRVMNEINKRIGSDSGDLIFYKDSLKTPEEMGGGIKYWKEHLTKNVEPKNIYDLLMTTYKEEERVGRSMINQNIIFSFDKSMKQILTVLGGTYKGYEIKNMSLSGDMKADDTKKNVYVTFKNKQTQKKFDLKIQKDGQMKIKLIRKGWSENKLKSYEKIFTDLSKLGNTLQDLENRWDKNNK